MSELTDILQSVALLMMSIGVIINSVRIKKLTTEARRCLVMHPDGALRCQRQDGHGGQHRAVYNDDLHVVWPIRLN